MSPENHGHIHCRNCGKIPVVKKAIGDRLVIGCDCTETEQWEDDGVPRRWHE